MVQQKPHDLDDPSMSPRYHGPNPKHKDSEPAIHHS
jgi:hypothetical protein